MVAALLLLAAAAPPACAVDHARYVLRGDRHVTLTFHVVPRSRDWWSELAGELRLPTGRTSWWLPTGGGSSGQFSFVWTAFAGSPQAAPGYPFKLRALRYFGFDAGYAVLGDTLHRSDRAPAHILLDGMRDAFWYEDDPATRSSPPPSLFDLVDCTAPADTPAVLFPYVP